MKKFLICMVALVGVFFTSVAFAGDSGVYVGIGGSYVVGAFELDDGYLDSDSTNGFNLKIGYRFCDIFSLELKYNNLAGFEGESDEVIDSYEYPYNYSSSWSYYKDNYDRVWALNLEAEVDIKTLILAAKVSLPNPSIVKPFVIVGLGLMEVDTKELLTYSGTYSSYSSYSGSNSDSFYDEYPESNSLLGLCGKIGVGIDFFVTKNVALGVEAAYIMGTGEVDRYKYMNYTTGLSIYF